MIETRWLMLWALGLLLPSMTMVVSCLVPVPSLQDFSGVWIEEPLALPVLLLADGVVLAAILLPGTALCVLVSTRIQGSRILKAVFIGVSILVEMVVLGVACVAIGIFSLMTSGLSGIQ